MLSVLVVEDDMPMRSVIARMLQNSGFKVTSVGDAEQALEEVKEHKFDLLLTDIVMPGMDGIELARTVSKENPNMQIVFISGFASVAKQDKEFPHKKTKLLSKPFNLRDMVSEVKTILGVIDETPVTA